MMIVSPDKFQAVIVKINSKMDDSYFLFIDKGTILKKCKISRDPYW